MLCIDDEPNILRLLRLTVDDEPDFEIVATTTRLRDFQRLVVKHRPDVLIIDHAIPDPLWERSARYDLVRLGEPGKGLELIEGARKLLPDATIVVFTGRAGLEEASRNAGADVYIEKPHVEALWPAIREVREY